MERLRVLRQSEFVRGEKDNGGNDCVIARKIKYGGKCGSKNRGKNK